MNNQHINQNTSKFDSVDFGKDTLSNLVPITQILHAATTGASPRTAFQNSIEELQKILCGDRVAILLKDPDRNILTVFASAGYPQGVTDIEIPISEDNTGWVMTHQRNLRINHVVPQKGSQDTKAESVLIVPISHDQTYYGVFITERSNDNEYTNSDEDIINILGSLFGIILSNHELGRRIEQAKGLPAILSRVTSKLRLLSDKLDIINTASQEIGKSLLANKVQIIINIDDPQLNIDPLESVFESKEGVFIPGQHLFSEPIYLNQHNIGAINSERDKAWTDEEQTFIKTIAEQISFTIEKSLLLGDKQKYYHREKVITDITNKVWSSQSIELILQTAIKEIGNALDADEAIIRLD